MPAMTKFLLSLFPGCAHRRTTFPLTPVRRTRPLFASTPTDSRTYVVCLDCGKEFTYNWREMRIEGSLVPQTGSLAALKGLDADYQHPPEFARGSDAV